MNDCILDIRELVRERPPVLVNSHLVRDYSSYLAVNFRAFHGSPIGSYTVMPNDLDDLRDACAAHVNKGCWIWACGHCGNTMFIDKQQLAGFCLACLWPGDGRWARIVLPVGWRQIEQLLLQMPGHRYDNDLRDWKPTWTTDVLAERISKAVEQVLAGNLRPKRLSIAPARMVSIGEIVQASYLNNNVQEPLDDMSGEHGVIEFRHGIRSGGFTTSERDAISSPPDGTLLWNETDERLDLRYTDWTAAFDPASANESFAQSLDDKIVTPESLSGYYKVWESNNIEWNDVGDLTLTVPHSLGKVPSRILLSLVAKASNNGYAQDDVVDLYDVVKLPTELAYQNSIAAVSVTDSQFVLRTNLRDVSIFDSSIGLEYPGIIYRHDASNIQLFGTSLTIINGVSGESTRALELINPEFLTDFSRLYVTYFGWGLFGSSTMGMGLWTTPNRVVTNSLSNPFSISRWLGEDAQDDIYFCLRASNGDQYSWNLGVLAENTQSSGRAITAVGQTLAGTTFNQTFLDSFIHNGSATLMFVHDRLGFDISTMRFTDHLFRLPHKTDSETFQVDPDNWDLRLTLLG